MWMTLWGRRGQTLESVREKMVVREIELDSLVSSVCGRRLVGEHRPDPSVQLLNQDLADDRDDREAGWLRLEDVVRKTGDIRKPGA